MKKRDDRFSRNGQSYLTLNFDNLTENGVKDLISSFNRQKNRVADVVASNRAFRKDGALQKRIQLIFENGQTVTILVGEAGDIIQTKLNATIIPINALSNETSYTKEVGIKMKANQPKYDKMMARKAAAAIKDTSAVKPASRSLATRITEAQAALDTAQASLSAQQERLATLTEQEQVINDEIQDMTGQLADLRNEEAELLKQLKDLGGAA